VEHKVTLQDMSLSLKLDNCLIVARACETF